jgi:polysaccharide deacetylase 2 family uncharacterized protein YibQ
MKKLLPTLLKLIPALCILLGAGLSYRLLSRRYPALRLAPASADEAGDHATEATRRDQFEAVLFETLDELEVRDDEIQSRLFLEDTLRELHTAIPRGKPLEWVVWRLSQAAVGSDYSLTDCFHRDKSGVTTMVFQSSRTRKPRVMLSFVRGDRFMSNAAKMAILIEEFDFEADQTTIGILSFPEPLTVSLVASARKAAWTAKAAEEYSKEIVIHLPLEPAVRIETPYRDAMILVHYPEETIREMIEKTVLVIPRFAGFGNLYGSRACEDSRVMTILMSEIARRRGYFIETRTARNSVAEAIARRHGVPYARIASRIDPDLGKREIEEQLKHLGFVAQKTGSVVVSAPASERLIGALSAAVPFLRQNGVRLTPISAVVDQYDHALR